MPDRSRDRGNVLTTAPSVEPVTLREMKMHARIDTADFDDEINKLITQSRTYTEKILNRSLVTQTWTLYLDKFPASDYTPIELPRPPLQSVTSVQYIDTDGNQQTWSSTLYTVDTGGEPGSILPAYNQVYPNTRNYRSAVEIEYVAGYASTSSPIDLRENIPEPIKIAIMMLAAHWFENKEIVAPINLQPVKMAYDALLMPYRLFAF